MKPDAAIGYSIEPLHEHHDRASFSCGVEPLDRYLKQQAGQDARKHVAAPFLLIHHESGAVAGFYTLASTTIVPGQLPPELARKLPRYPLIPATLLGRLAVDAQHRSRGLGEFLLLDALSRSAKTTSQVASFAVVVDAKDESARKFYLRYQFIPFADQQNQLFLPMTTIAKLFA